jgi:C-terminal processing protease CtpA/Prc
MIGELNSSHSGAAAGGQRPTSTGRLGLRFDRLAYESAGAFKVTEVVGLSPAAVAGIKVGESLTSVDGHRLSRSSNLEQLLDYTIDRKIDVGVSDAAGKERTVSLKPVRLAAEKALVYRDWVNRNREYVDKVSGGRLGYVHMIDMGIGSLNQLYLDLDTDNVSRQGVIVDVRNNNGGFVNAYALDVLARHGYMTMTPRILRQPVPARSQLGQRALELPTILVTNQHSLSDAEDFTEGYRALGLGKVVGEPTAGWIIYTGGIELIDGTAVRMPFIRIKDHEGKEMEMHPRAVDIAVSRALGESYKGVDSQLDAAIKELLSQTGRTSVPVKAAGQ